MIILPKEPKCEFCKKEKASTYWLDSFVCLDCRKKANKIMFEKSQKEGK